MPGLNLIITSLSSMAGTTIPRFLPMTLFWVNQSLVEWHDARTILILCVLWATVGTTFLWFFDWYIHRRIDHHEDFKQKIIKKVSLKKKKKPEDIVNTNQTNQKPRIGKVQWRLTQKIQQASNPYIIGLIVAVCTSSILHDIFVVEISRKKQSLPAFIFRIFIGKILLFAPLVFGRQWLMSVRA